MIITGTELYADRLMIIRCNGPIADYSTSQTIISEIFSPKGMRAHIVLIEINNTGKYKIAKNRYTNNVFSSLGIDILVIKGASEVQMSDGDITALAISIG